MIYCKKLKFCLERKKQRNKNQIKMQRLLREIFCISFIIVSTLIYGNLFVLLMNKIEKSSFLQKQKQILQNNTSLINTTIINNLKPNLKIHYPTMLILFADDNINRDI